MKITLSELAKKVGYSERRLSFILEGNVGLSVNLGYKLANILGITFNEVLAILKKNRDAARSNQIVEYMEEYDKGLGDKVKMMIKTSEIPAKIVEEGPEKGFLEISVEKSLNEGESEIENVRLLNRDGVFIRFITRSEAREYWEMELATCHDEKGVEYMKMY